MEKHLYETYRQIEAAHWWFVGRRKIVIDLLRKYVGPTGRVFDFGCNAGFFAGELDRVGFDAYGADISEEAIAFGRSNGIKNLFVTVGKRLPFPDGHFDAVLALDVLEHIEHDLGALEELRRVLRPGGIIIVTVPAFMFLWGLQDVVAKHFRRYRKKTLCELLEKGGFSIRRLSYFNFLLFPPIALVRFFQRLVKPKRKSDFDLNNRAVNAILQTVFLAEARLLEHFDFPVGVSLMAVAVTQSK